MRIIKKLIYTFIFILTLGIGSIVCTDPYNLSKDKNDDALNNEIIEPQEIEAYNSTTENVIKIYDNFLDGKINIEGIDIYFLTSPKGEPNRHYTTKYALFDTNGDKIPELHIESARYYYILSYINNKLIIFNDLSAYPQCYALNNGAFISHHFGTAPISDEYNYFVLDFLGKKIWELNFSKYDSNENGNYDINDVYLFDGVNVSKEVWDALTARYLYIDGNGIEQIKNEIEWNMLYE